MLNIKNVDLIIRTLFIRCSLTKENFDFVQVYNISLYLRATRKLLRSRLFVIETRRAGNRNILLLLGQDY